jgi:hypothetical protein
MRGLRGTSLSKAGCRKPRKRRNLEWHGFESMVMMVRRIVEARRHAT